MVGTASTALRALLAVVVVGGLLGAQERLVGPEGSKVLTRKPDRLMLRFAETAPTAESLGLDASQLHEHPLPGFMLVTTPDAGRDLVRLKKHAAVSFATPIYADDFGGDLFPSQDIIILLREGASFDEFAAWLEARAPGAWKAHNWEQIDGAHLFRTTLSNGIAVLELAALISERPETVFAEPDLCFTGKKAHVPTDPRFNEMWGSNLGLQLGPLLSDFDIDAPEAWDLTRGHQSIAVAVLDDGVQLDHPDMPYGFAGIDTTSQAPGNNGGPFNAFDNHGTSVASLIVARMDNAFGIAGTAPETRLHAVRCYLSTNISDFMTMSSWTVAALTYCENVGVRITNNSVVLAAQPMATTTKYNLTAANGMIHYAAAGNDPLQGTRYPANLASVHGLIGITYTGVIASFSASGTDMSYSAPADQVITCDRSGADGYLDPQDFVYQQGTSFATAYASAIAALVLGVNPTLGAAQVDEILKDSAFDLGAEGFDATYANGLLNAFGAVWRAALTRMDPESVLYMKKSSQVDARMGSSVATLADIDGDGRPDYAIGASSFDGLVGVDSGRVEVFSGASGLLLWSYEGTTPGENLGAALASCADIDSDGIADLAVGSPRFMVASSIDAGRVTFLSGANGSFIRSIDGAASDELFGSSLCDMGDLNTDGYGDLAVGAPGALVGVTPGTGRIVVLSGLDGSALSSAQGDELAGELAFGFSLARTADKNADGWSDLLVGAPKSLYAGLDSGAAIVIESQNGNRVATMQGTAPQDRLGVAVAVWGDQNADGFEDYVIGAPGYAPVAGPDAGIVVIFSSQNLLPIIAFFGESAGDLFGSALVSSSDIDGDGGTDLVIGAPGFDGATLNDIGKVEVYSTASMRARYELVGGASNQAFGAALAALGDVDGDGSAEVLVGATGDAATTAGFGVIFPAANPASKGPLPLDIADGSLGSSGSGPYDVLFVNESSGGGDRTVEVGLNQDLNYAMLQPLANPNPANFALYAYLGVPPSYLYYTLPFGIGEVLWLPCTVTPGNPIGLLVTNSTYLDPCPQLVGSFPTPWRYTHSGGLPFPLTVTLYGIIEETPATLAVTNAIVLKIQ